MMNKGLIRKFATIGITLACALVMTATLPGCISTGKCGKSAQCSKKCNKPCGSAKKCDKGCQKPCCKKGSG